MHPVTIVLLVILVILIGLLVGLYFFGKKTQKKQEEQQAQIEASKQTVSMLVIDKKRMPLKAVSYTHLKEGRDSHDFALRQNKNDCLSGLSF